MKSFPDQKKCAIDHENGQNCPKSQVLTMSPESCSRAHGPLKSSSDHKTVCYSPEKRPEQQEIMSFDDVARMVYRGSQSIEIIPGPEKVRYRPSKLPELPEIMSFDDVTRVVF